MIEFIYSDPSIIVAIKPAGVLSTDEPGGMPQLVRQTLGDDDACVRTVHRLDRVVSGLMVLALACIGIAWWRRRAPDATRWRVVAASALVVPASLVVTHALHRPRSQPVGTGMPARPAASSRVVPPSISTDVPVRAKLTV